MRWIFDAVRQFGPEAAMRVVQAAKQCGSKSIVAFGIGGDELSIATQQFRPVYDQAAALGLHRLIHAGEIGGPEKIREAVELLGVERIGHGIAAMNEPALMDLLADRRIPLEVSPQSNVRTGALAYQLRRPEARIEDHPLATLFRHGIPIALSTDDPAMFHTTLLEEYEHAHRLGMTERELLRLAQMSFDFAFERQHSHTAS
jgi:aminodeoxyfutalosine deaminase